MSEVRKAPLSEWFIAKRDPPSVEYAAQTAVAAVASYLIAGLFRLPEAYWAPMSTLIVTQSTSMRTLPVGLRYFLRDPNLGTDWGALMAASTLVLLPVIGLFVAAQRQFLQGLLAGSLKG